jgi:hypothetical protein
MDQRILGMTSDSFYALVFLLLLVILGVVSFHYYVYVSSGKGSALSAGTGLGFTLLPGRGAAVPMAEERRA